MKLFVVVLTFVIVSFAFAADTVWESVPDWSLSLHVYTYEGVPVPKGDITQGAEPQVNSQGSQQDAQGTMASTGPQPPANGDQAQCAACDDKKEEELQIYRDGNAIQRELVGIGRFTLWSQITLSALQVFVAVIALINSQKSMRAAESARRAADRAALAVQRYDLSGLQEDGKAEATCYLANAGRTPAILMESFTGCIIANEIPPPLDPKTISPTWTGEKNIYPGEGLIQSVGPLDLRTAQRKAIQSKSYVLFFYGCFVYRDVVGGTKPHETVFFTEYNVEHGQFREIERPGYNYTT